MHESAYNGVKDIIEQLGIKPKRVYDIGSYNVNGTYRTLFGPEVEYVGYDVRPGPGVDVVMRAPDVITEDGQCDLLLCCSTLEHCKDPFGLLRECRAVTKPRGYCILCAPFVWPVHDHPEDYWRFTYQGLRLLLTHSGFECLDAYTSVIKGKHKADSFAIGKRM